MIVAVSVLSLEKGKSLMTLSATDLLKRAVAQPLSIIYRPIAELKPDPKNPRSHSPKQVN